MRIHISNALASIGIGLSLLSGGMGCATASDLEGLNQGLSRKLETTSGTVRADLSGLRAQLRTVQDDQEKLHRELTKTHEVLKAAVRSELDDLRTQVERLQLETKAALEEMTTSVAQTAQTSTELKAEAARNKQDLGRIEAFAADASKQLPSLHQGLSTLGGRIEQLPSLVTGLGAEMRSLTETLVGTYELEEVALKDRLKALELVKKRLKPIEARRQ